MSRTSLPALTLVFASNALVACRSDPGAEPHAMSAAHHDTIASGHEAEARQHATMHDPTATGGRCGHNPARSEFAEPCWSADANPTAEHRREAEQHRRAAEEHRAASAALREAEARACVGLASSDRDLSPFAHRDDIAAVTPLTEPSTMGRITSARTVGATVVFRAVPRLTAEYLQRVVNCHVARNAVLGHDAPAMSFCPLAPRGVEARVSSTGDGFAVAIRADDADVAAEVLRRALRLASVR